MVISMSGSCFSTEPGNASKSDKTHLAESVQSHERQQCGKIALALPKSTSLNLH